MEYYSAIKRNTFESVLMRWMNLEPTTQREVSQKEKHKYYILMHICGLKKDGSDESVCRAWVSIDIEYGLVDRVGKGEGGDKLKEQHWDIYITICKIDSQWEFAVWCWELKPRDLWRPRGVGWGGRWEGSSTEKGQRDIYGGFMLMYGKN